MKKKVFTILCLICLTMNAFAKKGPQIPNPKISAAEAILLATTYFKSDKIKVADDHSFQKDEYILISLRYTDNFKDSKDWAWKIVFIHPKQNDHSVTFKVTDRKNIKLMGITE